MICYPLLPEPYYYASPEQQATFYGRDTEGIWGGQERLQANIDICAGDFESISQNVRAWTAAENKYNKRDIRISVVRKRGEGGIDISHEATNLQEAIDYLVTLLWLGMEKCDE